MSGKITVGSRMGQGSEYDVFFLFHFEPINLYNMKSFILRVSSNGEIRLRKILALLLVLYIGYFTIFRVEDEIAFSTVQAAPSPAAGEFTIPVLTYHSITDQAGSEYEVTAKQFNLQMAYLHSHGYHSINLKQFDTFMKRGMPVPDKLVLITFDDGYRNNYDMAFPILKKYGYTAALFVITDWVNSKPYMSWTQIKALKKGGWDIMAHSRTHPHLPLQSKARQQKEIAGSKNRN